MLTFARNLMKDSTVISSSGMTCLTATKQAAMMPWKPEISMYLHPPSHTHSQQTLASSFCLTTLLTTCGRLARACRIDAVWTQGAQNTAGTPSASIDQVGQVAQGQGRSSCAGIDATEEAQELAGSPHRLDTPSQKEQRCNRPQQLHRGRASLS